MMLGNTRRLQLERTIMAKQLPQFQFYEIGEHRYFKGWQRTSTGGRYLLELDLHSSYPDEMPSLYVVWPVILWKHGGGNLNSFSSSHAYHTLSNGPGGCVQICHCKPSEWDASRTCWGVFMKGILWVEAHGVSMVTGMTIENILEEWKRRQI